MGEGMSLGLLSRRFMCWVYSKETELLAVFVVPLTNTRFTEVSVMATDGG